MPLFVDLDGTLIKTDLLAESALALLKQAPWMIFAMCLWLLRGKAYLKARIAERVSLESDTLPLQNEFVAYLRAAACVRARHSSRDRIGCQTGSARRRSSRYLPERAVQ